jgi:hypothetical protein
VSDQEDLLGWTVNVIEIGGTHTDADSFGIYLFSRIIYINLYANLEMSS